MASKRELKRDIEHACSNLFIECVAASLYSGDRNPDDMNALFKSIFDLSNQYVQRISHPEPGMNAKQYFMHLKNEFHKQASEIADQITNLE